MNSRIEKIILKFVDNNASSLELELLLQWISSENNYNKFVEYVSINNITNIAVNQADKDRIFKEIDVRIKAQKKSKSFNSKKIIDYSILTLIFTLSIGLGIYLNVIDDTEIKFSPLDPSKITLITSEGQNVDLEAYSADSENVKDFSINTDSKTISFEKTKKVSSNAFNTLKVPYGKTFNINLSDGTNVYLNSGTSIKFPTTFKKGSDREVFISGEAFFDVRNNNSSRFIVKSNLSSAIVFGTKFNFKDYPEDSFSEIILTEGSLGVRKLENSEQDKLVIIKPGERAKVSFETGEINRSRVNTNIYTSWIEGRVVFRNENLENMIRKLERIYNVIIINNNTEIKERFFSATILSEKETISDVLFYLKQVYGLKYQIFNNKIIIE
tara:strand:- start:89 stop:1240 length:1152 start_codon:yes stop_codon:yes gene_type:complete